MTPVQLSEEAIRDFIHILSTSEKRLLTSAKQLIAAGKSDVYKQTVAALLKKEQNYLFSQLSEKTQNIMKSLYGYTVESTAQMIDPSAVVSPFVGIHRRALTLLIRNKTELILDEVDRIGRRAGFALQKEGISAIMTKFAENQTWQEAATEFEANIKGYGLLRVPYANGRSIRTSAYAEMFVRTASAETTNLATINQMTEMKEGLVKIDSHSTTCKICASRQGRVYRIMDFPEGDPRNQFPHISQGLPRWPTYKTIHPNCRHALLPYIWDMKSSLEKEVELENAKKPFNTDPRSEAERQRYEAAQAVKDSRRRDLREYDLYKNAFGSARVPKTFAGFRSMKRADSVSYRALRNDYRAMSVPQSRLKTRLKGFDVSSLPGKPQRKKFFQSSIRAVTPLLTQADKDMIEQFSGTDFEFFNSYLRRGSYETSPGSTTNGDIDRLDHALEKFTLNEPITVLRGAHSQEMFNDFFKHSDIPNKLGRQARDYSMLVGRVFSEPGYMSTTVSPKIADKFTGEVRFEITIPAGKGHGAYIEPWSYQPQEEEILLPRGSKFLVTEVRSSSIESPGPMVVKMELLV